MKNCLALNSFSPPWDMPDKMFLPNFGALHIILDPGVVFGTGTNPTTHDCLDLIEIALKKEVKMVSGLHSMAGFYFDI